MAHTPSLSREELTPQLVTDADAFVVGRYLRQREDAPALVDVERAGEKKFPGAAAVLADVFNMLWTPDYEPAFRAEEDVRPDRQYARTLLGKTAETSDFRELHGRTRADPLLSFVGTLEAGRTILQFVPAEDKEKLEKLAEAQAKSDELEQAAAEAEANAQTLAQMADVVAQGQGHGQPGAGSPSGGSGSGAGQPGQGQSPGSGQPSGSSSGQPSGSPGGSGQMTAQQAQALADQLTQKWEAAEAKAGQARAQAQQAKAAAEAQVEALMGKPGSAQARAKSDELQRLGMAGMKAASKTVEELSKTVQAWGVEAAELNRKSAIEAFELMKKLQRSESLKRFAALLGRMRAMVARKAKSKADTGSQRVPRQETGRDLARVQPRELARLAHSALRAGFYQDWSRGALQLRGTQEKKTLGRGPVIVCEDASGSMDGAKQQWAKGVVLSLAYFARLQRRSYGYIMYDSSVHTAEVYPEGRIGAEQLLAIAEARAGGGTNFEAPLKRAVEMIEREGLKKADIAFITDGDCAVSEKFLLEFLAAKRRLEFTVIAVICDAGGHVTDETVKKFADRVERASSFTADEAEQKVFAHL